MPLYSQDPYSAKNNKFIEQLYLYRTKRDELDRMSSLSDSNQIRSLVLSALGCFSTAINFALREVQSADVQDQEDFKDWLRCSENFIAAVYLELANFCKKIEDEDHEVQILEQFEEMMEKIEESVPKDENPEEFPEGFWGKIRELDHTQGIALSRPGKEAVRENYKERFFDFIDTLDRAKLLKCWYKEEANINWLQSHYKVLQDMYSGLNSSDLVRQWDIFCKKNQLIVGKKERESDLRHLVERSIELCYVWEKMRFLDQLKAKFADFLEQVKVQWNKAINSLKSVGQGMGDNLWAFLRTLGRMALWPIVATGCLLCNRHDVLAEWNADIKDNWIAAANYAMEHPWTTLLLISGITGIGFATSSILSFTLLTTGFYAVESVVLTSGAALLTTGASFFYQRDRYKKEKEAINGTYSTQMMQYKIQCSEEQMEIEKSYREALQRNASIAAKQRPRRGAEELRDLRALRAAQRNLFREFWAMREEKRQKEAIAAGFADDEDKREHDIKEREIKEVQELKKKTAQLLESMNVVDIYQARKEYRDQLAKINREMSNVRDQQQKTELDVANRIHHLSELALEQSHIMVSLQEEAETPEDLMLNPTLYPSTFFSAKRPFDPVRSECEAEEKKHDAETLFHRSSWERSLMHAFENWVFYETSAESLRTSICDEREPLTAAAQKYGYTINPVARDGNCFFHAIADQLRRSHPSEIFTAAQLRALAVEEVIRNINLYKDFTGLDEDQLVDTLSTRGEWADEIAIRALSDALQKKMVIIRSDNSVPTLIKPTHPTGTLILGYEVGAHYQSMLSSSGQSEITPALAADLLEEPLVAQLEM